MRKTNSRHTPGPWEAIDCIINNEPNRMIIRTRGWGGKPLADCGITDTDESRHNAALMALAPDMLLCLRRAAPWMGRLIADGGHSACAAPGDAEACLAQIEALLNRLDGAT